MLIIITGGQASGKTAAAKALAALIGELVIIHDDTPFPSQEEAAVGIHIVTRQLCGIVPDWAQQENDPRVLRLYTQEAKLAQKPATGICSAAASPRCYPTTTATSSPSEM